MHTQRLYGFCVRSLNLESKAKIEQLVNLFGGEFRGGRTEAAPHFKQDPSTVGMVEALISNSAEQLESRPDTSVLPHLMPRDEIDRFFPVVHLDEGENHRAHTLGGVTRPSEELSDPGPKGKLEFVPARHEAVALVVESEDQPKYQSSAERWCRGCPSDDNSTHGVGAAQGLGAAHGLGAAQFDHDSSDITYLNAHIVSNAVTCSVEYAVTDQSTESEDPPAGRSSNVDSGTVEFNGRFRERLPVHSRYDSRHRRAHRWLPGQCVPGGDFHSGA